MSARIHPIWGAPAELSDTEHLRLALEFYDPECGREYLREQDREELIAEFDRLSDEEQANG